MKRTTPLLPVLALLLSFSACGLPSTSSELPAAGQPVSPGPCRVKTDMELPAVYDIPTQYHSRTRLPAYRNVFDGVTPATMRLEGGRGFLELPPAWQEYVSRINNDNPIVLKYLFHAESGWQNSTQTGQVEELGFEDRWLNVLSVSGDRAYVETFFSDQSPPSKARPDDLRQQLFTVVTADDRIIGSPKGDAHILLIARPGEQLWIPTDYLACPYRFPAWLPIAPGK